MTGLMGLELAAVRWTLRSDDKQSKEQMADIVPEGEREAGEGSLGVTDSPGNQSDWTPCLQDTLTLLMSQTSLIQHHHSLVCPRQTLALDNGYWCDASAGAAIRRLVH